MPAPPPGQSTPRAVDRPPSGHRSSSRSQPSSSTATSSSKRNSMDADPVPPSSSRHAGLLPPDQALVAQARGPRSRSPPPVHLAFARRGLSDWPPPTNEPAASPPPPSLQLCRLPRSAAAPASSTPEHCSIRRPPWRKTGSPSSSPASTAVAAVYALIRHLQLTRSERADAQPPASATASNPGRAEPASLMAIGLLFPDSSESVWSVRIRSTTLARLLHGFVLLPSGISVKMTISLDTITIIAMLVVSFLSLSRYLPLVV